MPNQILARYQTGHIDLCQIVLVAMVADDLFTVTNYQSIDGDDSPAKVAQFVNAPLAFQHALRLVAAEVEDLVDA